MAKVFFRAPREGGEARRRRKGRERLSVDILRQDRSEHRLARLMRTRHAGVFGGRRSYGCTIAARHRM